MVTKTKKIAKLLLQNLDELTKPSHERERKREREREREKGKDRKWERNKAR